MSHASPTVRPRIILGAPSRGITGKARRLLHVSVEWLRHAWIRRATRISLSGLDDRGLKDIGLQRGEIESVVATMGRGRRVRYGPPARTGVEEGTARRRRQAGGDFPAPEASSACAEPARPTA